MKKIILILILLMFTTVANNAFAQSVLPATAGSRSGEKANLKASVEANLMENLRERAKTEITRRLNFLNELLTKLSNVKKITVADKTSLENQIQAQIDGLNALQTKIDSDTDITTLRTDVKSIINGYYIFAFFRVKISLLFAADRLSNTADSLSALELKLKARVDQAAANGENVTNLNLLLSDMTLKINNAKTKYQAVQTDLNGLDATGYPGNKSTLLDARSKLKLAAADLRAAFQDAVKIRKGLGDLGEKIKFRTSSDSAKKNLSPTSTPTPITP